MTRNTISPYLPIALSLFALMLVAGCLSTALPLMRTEVAQRIAAPAWMIKREIPAEPFSLTVFERVHERGGTANIYIEGDGSNWVSPGEWENNPTPKNPVALHLASKDNADNLIYLARPCQYSGMIDATQECPELYWKDGRYSPDVIDAYNAALDEISKRYGFRGYHLIGYSGGGAIAAILAARRSDVLSLRTIAGVLNPDMQSDLLGVPHLQASLNPVSEANNLAKMPQYHFIGGQDQYVMPGVLHSYLQALPDTRCVNYQMVQEAEYDAGWVDKWPELLKRPVTCRPGQLDFQALELPPEPRVITREVPEKP